MTGDALACIAWHLDTYAGHWLTDTELTAVTQWMVENRVRRATADRPVTVQNALITYGQDRSGPWVRGAQRDIVTVTTPLRSMPPKLWHPACDTAAFTRLTAVLRRHEWSAGHGGVCVDCSHTFLDTRRRVCCVLEDAVAWPCPDVQAALTAAHIGTRQGGRHD